MSNEGKKVLSKISKRLPAAATSDFINRLGRYIMFRWLYIAILASVGVSTEVIAHNPGTDVIKDLLAAGVGLVFNGVVQLLASRYPKASLGYYRKLGWVLVINDIILAASLIYNRGGVESRTIILYAVPIVIAAGLFGRLATYVTAAICAFSYDLILGLEWFHISRTRNILFPALHSDRGYVLTSVVVYTMIMFILASAGDFVGRILLQEQQTLRRRTEEEKAKDEVLLESIGEGLIATDEYGNITNCNEAASGLLGYQASELVGEWFPKAILVTDEYGKEIPTGERPISQALSTGEVVTATAMYIRKDGSTFPVFMTVSPVVVDGRPIGAVEVFRDISSERELERAKDEFVSLASHQLRTPASGVKAFTSMLMDGYAGKLTAKQRQFLQKVYDSNERQLRIIDDMLNVARADTGHLVLKKAKTDLKVLLEKITTEQGAVAASRQQTLKFEASPGKFDAVVDEEKMRMAVDNLVSNAIKYTHDGGHIVVKLSRQKNKLLISIIDSGVGISKPDFKRLFQRFSRIDNELSAQVGGSGLGLYLVNTIVEMHGGEVEVESTLGKGSTFTICLPSQV
ncbi:MAG TPA: ATP-binding protein [Candidatus Nanoarchaeia archaeon]|nr:ATP-binding protein [Candidatus Nanoarchaeia archaeon]